MYFAFERAIMRFEILFFNYFNFLCSFVFNVSFASRDSTYTPLKAKMCSANTIELKAIKDQFEIGVFAFEEAKNEFEVCNFLFLENYATLI